MAKYRKKPVVIEATQWFIEGDHPEVDCTLPANYTAQMECEHCKETMDYHGWVKTLEGQHIVCPSDWIITGVKGEIYPCKPDIFAITYERVS